jgi:metal-responsive CopG/Arc/MetJ family transcriptional regulator
MVDLLHSIWSVIRVLMDKAKGKVTLKIPKPLYDKLKEVIRETGFNSVTEFAVYVLRDIVSAKTSRKGEEGLSGKEIEAIRKRLRSLGYL